MRRTTVIRVNGAESGRVLAAAIKGIADNYNPHMQPIILGLQAKFGEVKGKTFVHLNEVETDLMRDALNGKADNEVTQ